MAQSLEKSIADHYDRDGLEEAVLSALRVQHGGLSGLTPDDLSPVDEFHIRGRQSTDELAALAGDMSNAEVLDVGSGLGGTARYLASTRACRVTGIDLTPRYVTLAKKLSDLVSLSSSTDFRSASALDLPFGDEQFDVVWMAHVQMNIEEKEALARELCRVLKKGGRLALHEVFSNAEPQPHFPVPWADAAPGSFLVSAEEFRRILEQEGMQADEWRDVTQPSLEWAGGVVKRLAESGPPPLGLHLLMGETAGSKLENIRRSLEESRVSVVQAVFSKH